MELIKVFLTKLIKDSAATVKGRDYYDLLWYLEKGVNPNMETLY